MTSPSVTNKRPLIVSKRDGFQLETESWTAGETITSFTATNTDGLLAINATEIDGQNLKIAATGVAPGWAKVCFSWETETLRTQCVNMTIEVIEGCCS